MSRYSIIIPVYNAENTIERCVNSILNNTCQEFEIILVDDGSSDDSYKKCCSIARKDSRIRIASNISNRGVSYTRNHGLRMASGEYILFVDSDDWVDDDYIAGFDRVIREFGADLVICGYVNHDEKMNSSLDFRAWTDFSDVKACNIDQSLLDLYKDTLLQQLWNKVFVNRIIQQYELRFDETISIGEDFRFILHYLERGRIEEAILLNKTPYHYMRDQDGSLMFRIGYESIEETLENLRNMYRLSGVSGKQLDDIMDEERRKQIELRAYLICHNMGMELKEKKRLITALDKEKGSELWRKNRILFFKERILLILRKICRRRKSV